MESISSRSPRENLAIMIDNVIVMFLFNFGGRVILKIIFYLKLS